MCLRVAVVLTTGLLLTTAAAGRAQNSSVKDKDVRFILPLDALGDLDRLAAVKGVRLEGTCRYPERDQPTQMFVWTWHSPQKWRFDVHALRMPDILIVVSGEDGWLKVGSKTTALKDQTLRAMTDQVLWMGLAELTPLRSKDYHLSVLGDSKVKGKEVTCVKAAAEGWRDAKLYFDHASRLLVKAEFRGKLTLRPGKDAKVDRKMLQEFYFSDFRQTDGLKHWRRIAAYRNGRLSANFEVSSVRFLRKVDDTLFDQP
jgi:hypothetical protein